jgi:hypothetical protein
MTRDSKLNVLKAFDALWSVRREWRGRHGAGYICDICEVPEASNEPHRGDCPVGVARAALLKIVPPFGQRDKWLATS